MQPNLTLELDVLLETRGHHKPAFVTVDILDAAGVALMQALPRLEGFVPEAFVPDGSGGHRVRIAVELPPLVPGQYFVTVWVGSHHADTLDAVERAVRFEVHESPSTGRSYPHSADHGHIVPPSTASYETL